MYDTSSILSMYINDIYFYIYSYYNNYSIILSINYSL